MRLSYQACRSAGVECIVAPYEADAQLAYLSKEGVVDLIITEDSDLLVFGCRKVRMVSRHMNPHSHSPYPLVSCDTVSAGAVQAG